MKNLIPITLILSIFMLVLPLLALKEEEVEQKPVAENNTVYTASKINTDKFRVFMPESKEIKEMSAEDYILCVVAAEMPALYETEALKAQAVAAYSFACRRRAESKNKDYDITADHTVDQSFISEAQLQDKWGDKAEDYIGKIRSAVKAVSGQAVTYKGDIALTLYHAISCGVTESSADIWGGEYPYLVSVDSNWDKLADNYLSKVTVSTEDFKEKLGSNISFEGKEDSWIKITEITKNGSVKKLLISGKEFTGEEIRKLFDLRSLNFTVEFKDGSFEFSVKGYGHGVGMSQNGANYMAKQGSNYKEILEYYYKGCTVNDLQ